MVGERSPIVGPAALSCALSCAPTDRGRPVGMHKLPVRRPRIIGKAPLGRALSSVSQWFGHLMDINYTEAAAWNAWTNFIKKNSVNLKKY